VFIESVGIAEKETTKKLLGSKGGRMRICQSSTTAKLPSQSERLSKVSTTFCMTDAGDGAEIRNRTIPQDAGSLE
jgi:hypothetical protein